MAQRHLFNIADIAAHCRRIEAQTPQGQVPNFDPVWSADFARLRNSAGCGWVRISVTDCNGVSGPYRFRFKGRQGGTPDPATPEGLAEANAWRASNKIAPLSKVRDRDPSVVINLYDYSPATDDKDSLTVLRDAGGSLIFKGEDDKPLTAQEATNPLGYVSQCFNTWFVLKIRTLKQQGVISDEQPMPGETPVPGRVYASSTKICPPMQTHISAKAPKHPSRALPNPIYRMRIKMDETGTPKMAMVYDGEKEYTDAQGKRAYEPLVDDDKVPLNNANIHRLLLSRSEVVGIAKSDSICLSNLGISVPTDVELLVVKRPHMRPKASLDDLFPDEAPPTAPASGAQQVVPPAAVTPAGGVVNPAVANPPAPNGLATATAVAPQVQHPTPQVQYPGAAAAEVTQPVNTAVVTPGAVDTILAELMPSE